MPNVGPLEIILVALIALLVLGPRRLPEAGRALGQGIRGFREALQGRDRDHHDGVPPADPSVGETANAGDATVAAPRPRGSTPQRPERHDGVYDEAQP